MRVMVNLLAQRSWATGTARYALNLVRALLDSNPGDEEYQLLVTPENSGFFRELTERIPEDTYLQSLNIQRGKLNMTGISENAQGLINVLSASEYLEGVESRYITKERSSGKDKFNFEAKVKSMEEVEP